MPSMFMDIFSPLKRNHVGAESSSHAEPELTGLALDMAKKRTRRVSSIEMSPKRIPLARTQAQMDNSNAVHDRPGRGPGKENVPPGALVAANANASKIASKNVKRVSLQPADQRLDACSGRQPPASRLFEPTASSRARTIPLVSKAQSKPKTNWNSNFLLPKPKINRLNVVEEESNCGPESNQELRVGRPAVPSRFVIPTVAPQAEDQYHLVPEGVADASMYENNWLGQQELAITQLINSLFDAASPAGHQGVAADLGRLRMLEIYGNGEMSLLYKRIQAALAYGPLCVFGEGADRAQQLRNDLAKRKTYTNFWLLTYEPRVLRLALEVIVGRVVPLRTSGRTSSDFAADQSRALRRFIEKFLIRNEDSAPNRRTRDDENAAYQRTILRSLMLVKLLDLMKTDSTIKVDGQLFQAASRVKTSVEAALTVCRMLNPSVGDRSLRNVGYTVSHKQYPLEEFDYNIANLAIDIRDGVRLTRLIELLLYRSASGQLDYDQDASATITLSSGILLSTTEGNQDWPLSQHLKLPCDSRAVKLYNVNLALAALREVRGMNIHLQDITAADIVDGFREKTVRLLWILCSKYGLGGLVDWEDIKSEVRRLGRTQGKIGSSYLAEFELDDEDDGFIQYKALLKVWVKAIAASHGLRVRNFTTDFADSRLFSAIVTEYQPYMPAIVGKAPSGDLHEQLKQLGCSNEFAKLFATKPGACGQQVFDRDFVLASLAFLASRLLRPSKASRAAVVLQRAWRRKLEKVLAHRKKVLQILATECAEHVHMVRAKTRIWRAWSQFRDRKLRQNIASPSGVDDIWLSL